MERTVYLAWLSSLLLSGCCCCTSDGYANRRLPPAGGVTSPAGAIGHDARPQLATADSTDDQAPVPFELFRLENDSDEEIQREEVNPMDGTVLLAGSSVASCRSESDCGSFGVPPTSVLPNPQRPPNPFVDTYSAAKDQTGIVIRFRAGIHEARTTAFLTLDSTLPQPTYIRMATIRYYGWVNFPENSTTKRYKLKVLLYYGAKNAMQSRPPAIAESDGFIYL